MSAFTPIATDLCATANVETCHIASVFAPQQLQPQISQAESRGWELGNASRRENGNLRNDDTKQPLPKGKTQTAEFGEDAMSSPTTRTESVQGSRTKQKPSLSSHYREIGIKAVAAAARKENTASPRSRGSMAARGKGTILKEKPNERQGEQNTQQDL